MKTRLVRKGILAGGLGLLLALALMLTAIPAVSPTTAAEDYQMQARGDVRDCEDYVQQGTVIDVTALILGVEKVIASTQVWNDPYTSSYGWGPVHFFYVPTDPDDCPAINAPMWFYIGGFASGERAECSTNYGPWQTSAPFRPWSVEQGPVRVDLRIPCVEEICNLTVNHMPPEGGTTDPSGGPAPHPCGENISLSASPTNLCWYFDYWSVDSGSCMVGDTNSPDTWIVVSDNCIVTAHFAEMDCDDQNECTTDWCDPVLGCQHTPIDCDDQDVCTTDWCDPVLGCQHTPIDCDDQDECTTDWCDPVLGCQHTPIDCDDQDECTTDTCDPATGCVHTPIDCDDQNECTTDWCDPATGCVHTPIDCDDQDVCTIDWCDPVLGCQHTPIDCDDSDECTIDWCDPVLGCQHTWIQYTLTTGVSGTGDVTPGGTYNCCQYVSVNATETDPCWTFAYWLGDLTSSNPHETIHMSDNMSVTAVFVAAEYELTVNSDGDGTTTPSGTDSYSCGENVTLLAEPNICTRFDHWSVDVGGCTVGDTSSPNTWIIVNEDCTVTAHFIDVEYVYLDSSSTSGGNVTDPGEGIIAVPCCNTIPLVATPDSNYVFDFWTSDCEEVDGSTNATESIHMVVDHWVVAHFKSKCALDCELTVSSTAGGEVTTPGEGDFIRSCGTTVNLIAEAESGFEFYKWIGSGVDAGKVDNPDSASTYIELDADYEVIATFSAWFLDLSQGWNILSTPIALDDCCNTWAEFKAFGGLDVDPEATTYWFDGYNQIWDQVLGDYELYPCDAIYVKMAHADTAPIIPTSGTSGAAKELYEDWNLISLAALQQLGMGLNNMKVNSALASIYLVPGDLQGYTQVVSPPADQESWYYIRDTEPCTVYMKIGKGYWVFMTNAGTLGGFTFTPW